MYIYYLYSQPHKQNLIMVMMKPNQFTFIADSDLLDGLFRVNFKLIILVFLPVWYPKFET